MGNTPIAYIVFNRPRHTRETFNAIRASKPPQLFIIADGPRFQHQNDVELCLEVRRIVEAVDWPCEVHRNYSDHNMGCKNRVISGLNWVFDNVERAIILEDDVLPHPDFFCFCDELLDRYKNDESVACITGNNFQNGQRRGDASYYFSRYNHVWGWATWRRYWKKNDSSLSFWPEWKKTSDWYQKIPNSIERNYWEQIFDKMYNNEIDTWDYQWAASIWYQGGLTATPNVNLITNIGFGPDATHTVETEDREWLPVHSLGALAHPDKVIHNLNADRYTFDHHFRIKDRFYVRLFMLSKLVMRKLLKTIKPS